MRTLAVLCTLIVLMAAAPGQEEESRLLRRWVGTHYNRPLHLDFYGDTMLVVNDMYAVDYYVVDDSIVAYGDTSFSVSYWFSRDRLLLQTEEGRIVTFSEQLKLARPLHGGRWRGGEIGAEDDMELVLIRGGIARWRTYPGPGEWSDGEWDRSTRIITFTWFPDTAVVDEVDEEVPDSVQWVAQYDPEGSALLFPETIPDKGTVVLRRILRW
jgi:hypothetical protein